MYVPPPAVVPEVAPVATPARTAMAELVLLSLLLVLTGASKRNCSLLNQDF